MPSEAPAPSAPVTSRVICCDPPLSAASNATRHCGASALATPPTWNILPTGAAFLPQMLPSQGGPPRHLILNSSPFLTCLLPALLHFSPGPCFLGHLTFDLLSAILETVSPLRPRHLKQCLAHRRCSVRTCGLTPTSSTSRVQDLGMSATHACLRLLSCIMEEQFPLSPPSSATRRK